MRRLFHGVYTLLALNFFIPVTIYAVAPNWAVDSFSTLGQTLGGGGYPHTEDSVLWRVLAIANVATLGFCCVLLQLNLRRFYPILLPLLFLKSMAALGFLFAYFVEAYPAYLAACLFDSATVFALAFFGVKAHAELEVQA